MFGEEVLLTSSPERGASAPRPLTSMDRSVSSDFFSLPDIVPTPSRPRPSAAAAARRLSSNRYQPISPSAASPSSLAASPMRSEELSQLQQQLHEEEERLRDERSRVATLESDVSKLRADLRRAEGDLRKSAEDYRSLQEQLDNATREVNTYKSFWESAKKENAQQSRNYQLQLEQSRDEAQGHMAALEQLQKQQALRDQRHQDAVKELEDKIERLMEEKQVAELDAVEARTPSSAAGRKRWPPPASPSRLRITDLGEIDDVSLEEGEHEEHEEEQEGGQLPPLERLQAMINEAALAVTPEAAIEGDRADYSLGDSHFGKSRYESIFRTSCALG